MGEFNTVGLEDIIDAFSRREAATVEAVPKMLKAGADVLIEAQRAEAQAMGLNETGGFINSIKATDVKGDDTEKYVEIYPQGRAGHGIDKTARFVQSHCLCLCFLCLYQHICASLKHFRYCLNRGGFSPAESVYNIFQPNCIKFSPVCSDMPLCRTIGSRVTSIKGIDSCFVTIFPS